MSSSTQTTPIQNTATAVGVFQAHFGAPPGGQDPKAECEKWERLCGELLAERERLRAELEKLRLEQIFREWDQIPVPSWEEVQSQIDRSMTFEQLIEEIERDAENES